METEGTLQSNTPFSTYGSVTKFSIIFLMLVVVIMTACSKQEEVTENTASKTESILVEESPWVFSGYQNSFITDDGGSGL